MVNKVEVVEEKYVTDTEPGLEWDQTSDAWSRISSDAYGYSGKSKVDILRAKAEAVIQLSQAGKSTVDVLGIVGWGLEWDQTNDAWTRKSN